MTGKTNNRMLLGVAALAVGIMFVLGWSFAPSFMTSVSAANQETAGGATTEMLNYALNFRSASNLAVFGGNSVSDNGSEIRGVVGSTGDVTGSIGKCNGLGRPGGPPRDLSDVFAITIDFRAHRSAETFRGRPLHRVFARRIGHLGRLHDG